MGEIAAKINKYFNGSSDYPLLVVMPFDEYKGILAAFPDIKKIKVSDYCIGPDKEPDIDKLHDDVRTKIGKYLLIGLGDYLASKTNITRKTMMSYKDMVLQPNSHVAILLSAHMYSEAKRIYDSDPRTRARIILPTAMPTSCEVKSNELVYGIKAYLEACEKGEKVGSVKTARNIDNATVINPENAYDELKHNFPDIFTRLSKDAGTTEQWAKLLEELNKTTQTLQQYLASQDFASLEYIFFNYAKSNDYKSWLYFINLKLNSDSKNYLGYVASKTDKSCNLFSIAKNAILDIAVTHKDFNDFYAQRKKMLRSCEDVDMADFTKRVAVHGEKRVAYLTDNTNIEKKAIIEALCDGANDGYLSIVYPDLYQYLQDYSFDDEGITEYFSLYKKCKLRNRIDDVFLSLVAKNARTRPYNSLPARSSLISSLDDGDTLLFYLDAFGVEYLGYVREKCDELGLRYISKVARSELPTTTTYNRNFFDDWSGKQETPIKDLDDLKHHPERGYDYNNSPYPIHLPEELDIINEALKRAKIRLQSGDCKKVVITSDHGASRLAVITPDVLINPNNCEPKSNGRYCVGDDLPTSDSIVVDPGRSYAVMADYSRFEGSRTASVETHGGATLEEVLIPVIELTLADSNIHVTLENSTIEVSYKTIPTLVLIITPDCENITATVNDITYVADKLEKSRFEVVMPKLSKGKHTISIYENQNKITSMEFMVKSKGFAERDIL